MAIGRKISDSDGETCAVDSAFPTVWGSKISPPSRAIFLSPLGDQIFEKTGRGPRIACRSRNHGAAAEDKRIVAQENDSKSCPSPLRNQRVGGEKIVSDRHISRFDLFDDVRRATAGNKPGTSKALDQPAVKAGVSGIG
jgi:hypothetical protein